MAHVRQADGAFPPFAVSRLATLLLALILVAVVAATAFGALGLRLPGAGSIQIDPAVIDAGRDWELMRRQQGGWVDPVIEAGRDWEIQRKQQSGQDI